MTFYNRTTRVIIATFKKFPERPTRKKKTFLLTDICKEIDKYNINTKK